MNTHILLVGEEKKELEIFEETLKQMHGAVSYVYAGEGLHALEIVQHNKPDIVFINYNIQPADSLKFLSVIKSEPKMRSIRVFLYATFISEEINKMARMLGASGCIEKTNCVTTFIRELKAILDPRLLPGYIFLKRLTNSLGTLSCLD